MKVKDFLHAGCFRTLCAVLLGLLLFTDFVLSGTAHAASWQWRALNGHEILTIDLDTAPKTLEYGRTGTNSFVISSADFEEIKKFDPAGGIFGPRNLLAGVSLENGQITIQLHNAGFGSIVTRPAPRQIKAEFFPDRLGTRWKSSGTLTTLAANAESPEDTPKVATPSVTPPEVEVRTEATTQAVTSLPQPTARTVRPDVLDPAKLAVGPTSTAKTQEKIPQEPTAAEKLAEKLSVSKLEKTFSDMLGMSAETTSKALPAQAPNVPADTTQNAQTPPVKTIPPSSAQTEKSVKTEVPAVVAKTAPVVSPAPAATIKPRWADRGTAEAPFSIVGKVNTGGPEVWPEDQWISTDKRSLDSSLHAAESAKTGAPVQADVPKQSMTAPHDTIVESSTAGVTSGQKKTLDKVEKTTNSSVAAQTTSMQNSTVPASAPQTNASAAVAKNAEKTSYSHSVHAVSPEAPISKKAEGKDVSQNATQPVIYVNEEGESVPPPPIPAKVLLEAQTLMESRKYPEALPVLEKALTLALTRPDREEALYLKSEALENIHEKNPLAGYETVVASTNEAMNYNLRSPRVPQALTRLGMANLHVGNLPEAEGYFAMLRNQYPLDAHVPINYYQLGKVQLDKGLNTQAAEKLYVVLQEYPDSASIKQSAFQLMTALYRQNLLEQAGVIESFIEKRWPRLYLEEESYLPMAADIRFRLKQLDDALHVYWTYFNLYPANPDNHFILWRVGDLYLMQGNVLAARKVFQENISRFPDTQGAVAAQLRLAEDGIHDGDFTLQEMLAVFDKTKKNHPEKTYDALIKQYPKSSFAKDAQLKRVMWLLWNRQYLDALAAADTLKTQSPFETRAREIMQQAARASIDNALAEGNDERILQLWEHYPSTMEMYTPLPADLRAAMARAYLVRNDETAALALLQPFLSSPKDARYGEYALGLFFSKHLREQNWNALLDLYDKVQSWDLPLRMRNQLDYVMALSAENLGLSGKALPMWEQLAVKNDIPLFQKAYATYYLAREAERRRDLKKAYDLNRETMNLFTTLQEERSDKADPARIQESIGSLMEICEVAGRIAESLEWADKYAAYVPEGSPDFVGLRFRIARLNRKLGDTSKWRTLLEDIVRREPESVFGRMAASELRTIEVSRDLSRFAPSVQKQ